MTEVKNVGIIGFGMIGKVHAYGYATLPYYLQPLPFSARITHVVTARADTANIAKNVTGAEFASNDFCDVTENPDIDIVHICTPNAMHLPPLLSAIRHNKHIYCDKPMVANFQEAEQVRFAVKNYTGVSQMTFHTRFFPAVQRAKQLIDRGKLGRILQFRIIYQNSSNASTQPFKWKHDVTGGVLRDLGSHALDVADHLVGPIDRLISDTVIAYPQRRDLQTGKMRSVFVEDAARVFAHLKNGGTGTIDVTKLSTGTNNDFRFEIYGDQGAVRFSLESPDILEYFESGAADRPFGGETGWLQIGCYSKFEPPDTDFPAAKNSIGWTRAHTACLAHFIQCIAAAEQAPTALTNVNDDPRFLPQHADLMQGYKIECLMQTILDSAQQQKWLPTSL
ncbi:MAG: Gfo/Idh/MocA family oxidoreductase [Planctomycetaceae bacterium]|nr:Gfo/Idh/MocA family oxidoreductase [Planctomycetaceae bacterium]